jgi:hypothetical protein
MNEITYITNLVSNNCSYDYIVLYLEIFYPIGKLNYVGVGKIPCHYSVITLAIRKSELI